MKNLRELAREITKESFASKSKFESINDSLVRYLHNTGEKLTRKELCENIAIDRMSAKFSEEEIEAMENPRATLKKMMVTVKNGIDQSCAKGENNASFYWNPKYSHLILAYNAKGEYWIEDAESAE